MKSTQEELKKRGFASEAEVKACRFLLPEQLESLLRCGAPSFRTAAARNMRSFLPEVSDVLLLQLSCEKCLYTKIAICECLEQGDVRTAEKMVPYLGRIGTNQHRKLPKCISSKKSYPLPRDIIARTLGKMRPEIFPVLLGVLEGGERDRIREVLDAAGFMAFYHPELVKEENALLIWDTADRYRDDEVILWKVLQCLSAFPLPQSEKILLSFKDREGILGEEAGRSLRLWKKS